MDQYEPLSSMSWTSAPSPNSWQAVWLLLYRQLFRCSMKQEWPVDWWKGTPIQSLGWRRWVCWSLVGPGTPWVDLQKSGLSFLCLFHYPENFPVRAQLGSWEWKGPMGLTLGRPGLWSSWFSFVCSECVYLQKCACGGQGSVFLSGLSYFETMPLTKPGPSIG